MIDLRLLAYIAKLKIQKLKRYTDTQDYEARKQKFAFYLHELGKTFFTGGMFAAFTNTDDLAKYLTAVAIGLIQMHIADTLKK
ncbi:hypothetical protein OH460_08840 [Vibrio sp. Makdt]|uniref:hypothetical protein n=1 Tax=Vibrio sp. Makdt TaxID=2998828 RepID=UPI0022CD47FB|nr:hypothetical protein [Vibrio sp. Makdt]MDA0152407.1 hypothetical protein [Vibrio sp. Makdt]